MGEVSSVFDIIESVDLFKDEELIKGAWNDLDLLRIESGDDDSFILVCIKSDSALVIIIFVGDFIPLLFKLSS